MDHVNFPADCEVVGDVLVFTSLKVETRKFYIKGYHPELHFFGTVAFLERGGSNGPETEVKVTIGLPSEYYLG